MNYKVGDNISEGKIYKICNMGLYIEEGNKFIYFLFEDLN